MNAKNKETKPVSKEALWKRQQRSRQNEENEKRDEIRKQRIDVNCISTYVNNTL
jgi:hypothetical protein